MVGQRFCLELGTMTWLEGSEQAPMANLAATPMALYVADADATSGALELTAAPTLGSCDPTGGESFPLPDSLSLNPGGELTAGRNLPDLVSFRGTMGGLIVGSNLYIEGQFDPATSGIVAGSISGEFVDAVGADPAAAPCSHDPALTCAALQTEWNPGTGQWAWSGSGPLP